MRPVKDNYLSYFWMRPNISSLHTKILYTDIALLSLYSVANQNKISFSICNITWNVHLSQDEQRVLDYIIDEHRVLDYIIGQLVYISTHSSL